MILSLVLDTIVVVSFMLLAGIFTKSYLEIEGEAPWYSKVGAALNKSWTVLWNGAWLVAVSLLDATGALADLLSEGAGEQLKSAVPAKYLTVTILAVLAIGLVARLRTLFSK